MTPATWGRVKRLFTAARELPAPRRDSFLERQEERETVKREARRLLQLDAGGGISTPSEHRDIIARVQEPHTFHPGELLAGRYEIVRFLARGGSGEVYEAEDRERGGPVAIKTLHRELADAAGVTWLRREVQAARQIDHPNVCQVFDFVQTPRAVFFTMELLPGETLAAMLQREGAFTERRALPFIRQMVAGLAAAHQAGVVHRDLKPGNIMICPRPQGPPRLVLMDFGLARHSLAEQGSTTRLTRSSLAAFGTPAYMAPEQIEGRPATRATDIYALGVVLFEMLTGELPFDDGSPLSMAVRKTKEAPPAPETLAPGLRPVWSGVIRRCLDPRPERRFSDVRDLLGTMETRSVGRVRWRMVQRRWRQGYWRYAAAALMAALLTAGLWRWAPWPRDAGAVNDWRRGVMSLHAGEPLIAAQWLERAVSQPRPPGRAYADLALAWQQLGLPDRARRALADAPWFLPAGDRAMLRLAEQRLAGSKALGGELADRAWLGGNKPGDWAKVLESEPGHLAARLHLAAFTEDAAAAEREYRAAALAAQAQGNQALARAIEAREGLARLQAGDLDGARRRLAKGDVPYRAGVGPCERFMVLWAGKPDDFAEPYEKVETIAAGFWRMPLMGGYGRTLQFDERADNMVMAVSLPLPGVRLCSGILESRVGRRSMAGASNDEFKIGAAPFENQFAPWQRTVIWADEPTQMRRTLSFQLNAALLAAAQAAHADDDVPTLDILVGDDTDVDYFKLTLVY